LPTPCCNRLTISASGQHHLYVGILFGGEPAELLHGSLLFDLVLSLHSDSLLFLGRKTHPRPIMAAGVRVATFYELPGIFRRVARGYFVQTPNAYFPVEPHFLIPGWQLAPVALRTWLLQRRDLGWMKRVEDRQEARAVVESIHLLNVNKLRQLFPDGRIYREKIGLFTKSITAWRPI
jgi:hypothetical protein